MNIIKTSEPNDNCNSYQKLIVNEEQAVYMDENDSVKPFVRTIPTDVELLKNVNYNEYIERALDEADEEAQDENTKYYTHDELFSKMRRFIDDAKI